jgi:thiosulfate reductase/polysulfide reductase chain A
LVLTTFKSSLFSPGTANSKWTREILHDNPVWINKNTAEKMGLKQGDKVRLESSAGALEVRVLTTERIHPESAALAEGFGHSALGRVARSQKFHSSDPDTGLLWWHKKGSGVNPFELIENRKDPLGGGQGSKDTIVTITKI